MGKPSGFMEFERLTEQERAVAERLRDYGEVQLPLAHDELERQAARCMNCGVPFCHAGCPLGNLIPEWNDWVYRGLFEEAYARLSATNNFPEFTGRLCPAPCEEACVLNINAAPVAIETIEKRIAELAFERGWVRPDPPAERSGKTVAIVGSGPAGLACAQQLNRAGHRVTVFERAERPGGLLRFGIPDFKLPKAVLDRRLDLLAAEGITFRTGCAVGSAACPVGELDVFDAAVVCGGADQGRDLPIPGRELEGIHMAMDFLSQQNRIIAGDSVLRQIRAEGKHVMVIGGGDTGSDCVGTALRQGAASVRNFELLAMPSLERPVTQPWPYWPMRLRTSTSHAEGGERYYALLTQNFLDADGAVSALQTVNVAWEPDAAGRPRMRELEGTRHEWRCDLVLLALGFVGPEPGELIRGLGLELDARGAVKTDSGYRTSRPGIFAAGDMRRGQSLVVWAIAEGREAARAVDIYLMGDSNLPTKGGQDLPRR